VIERQTTGWLLSFLVLAVIWGCSFAFIRIGLRALTPVQVASVRLLFGAVALLVIAAIVGVPLPRSRTTWAHLAVVAALLNAAPFTLFAIGQQHISSVLAGIINAATPLTTLLVILLAFPDERPTRERLAGLLVGFVGVAVVLGAWRGFSGGTLAGVVACLAAVCCYGIAFPYARRHLSSTGEPPIALAAGQVGVAALQMLPVLAVSGARPPGDLTPSVVTAMLALGVLGSGVAYILNYRIVDAAGASTASTVTYLTPVVAAVVGVALLGESVSWNQPVGGAIVLLGVAVAQGRVPGRSSSHSASISWFERCSIPRAIRSRRRSSARPVSWQD
jgi:drug/metabolite transporter (DMT)-like permease